MTTTDLKQLLTEVTPGPWFWHEMENNFSIYQIGVKPGYQARLADVVYWHANHTGDRRNPLEAAARANARLIALSPTLAQEVLALRAEVARLEGKEVGIRSWADVQSASRAALREKNDE